MNELQRVWVNIRAYCPSSALMALDCRIW